MRRQEIFNLVWADIDDNNRRIKIRKSKTDKATGKTDGAMIVLPAKAKMLLVALVMALIADADHALYVAQREEEGQRESQRFQYLSYAVFAYLYCNFTYLIAASKNAKILNR